jgi:hypothetical protein
MNLHFCLLVSMLNSGTPLTLSVSASILLSISSVSHPLKRVLRELNGKHLIEGSSLSVVMQMTFLVTTVTKVHPYVD